MARGVRLFLTLGFSFVVFAAAGGCFDPVYREGLPCGSARRCPGELVCSVDGRCVDPDRPDAGDDPERDAAVSDAAIDADIPIDGAVPEDAFYVTDAVPVPDAAPVRCDPVDQDCGVMGETCTFVVTDIEKPYRGYLGCVEVEGAGQVGEPCFYVNPAPGGGYYDDCAFGLICDDQEGICREPCPIGDTCEPSFTICESMRNVDTVLSPYGLCYPPPEADAGGPVPTRGEPK